jgi:glycosyltransferase involved in cell wall biosynthesis
MLDEILAATPPYPPHLHRHILQMYTIRHRRAPETAAEQDLAVYEYVTRTQGDKTGDVRIHLNPELVAWLTGPDERLRGWGPLSRLAAMVLRHNGDLRRRFDVTSERGYKAYACCIAMSVQSALRWPEELIDEPFRRVLWEPAPGIRSRGRIAATRGLYYVRRNASRVRHLDLSKLADLSQLLLSVLADIDEGRLPSYVLSPEQYEQLEQPVKLKNPRLRMSGLVHHLVVERGSLNEQDLVRPEVGEMLRREVPAILTRLRLPRRLREAHAAMLAPVTPIAARIVEPEPAPLVTVVGPLSHGSGLGAAARACVEAFKAARIPVEVLNHVAGWGRTDEAAGSGECTRIRGDVNVIHFNPDVLIENLSRFGLDQFENRYNIGYFVWETSKPAFAHRLGVDLVDEIWVPTEYCRRAFASITDKPVVVVRTPVPPIGELVWASRRCFDIAEDKYTYLYTCDGASRFTRKHPLAAVRAFRLAFPSDDRVQLVIKTQNTDHLPPPDERMYAEIRRIARSDRRVVVIDECFSSNEVHGLISVADCYVALHRSEGFGYGMAEAMKLRVPVIATGDSGNADFTTEATAYPVRFTRVPVTANDFVYEEPGQEWAEPDVEHAAQRMIEVRSDPRRAVRIERAFELIRTKYDERSVGETYRERIEAIRAGMSAGTAALQRGARA